MASDDSKADLPDDSKADPAEDNKEDQPEGSTNDDPSEDDKSDQPSDSDEKPKAMPDGETTDSADSTDNEKTELLEPVEASESGTRLKTVETDEQSMKQAPVLNLRPTREAIEADRDKWKATPQERRVPIMYQPQYRDADAGETDSADADKKPLDDEKPVDNGEQGEVGEQSDDTSETDGPSDNPPVMIRPVPQLTVPPAASDKDVRPTGIPLKSVSLSKLLVVPMESGPTAEHSGNRSNIPDELNEPFADTALDPQEWVKEFESESREVFTARQSIVDAIGLTEGMSIADVGSGTGLFVKLFSDAVGTSGRVFAIDISPRLVEYIEQRVESEGISNVDVVRNEPTSLMMFRHKVDRVFLCDTYHHFEYHKEMLASIFETLRPGGEVFLIDFERIPGQSRDWVLERVRANKQVVREEFTAAGFEYVDEITMPEFSEHYYLKFRRPAQE